jgi:tetratricopeptide (TPR) repeat protein
MHRHELEKAIGLFTRVVAAGDDEPELTDRARQFLAICRQRQAENGTQHEAEDPYVLAVYHRNRGDLAMALSIARRGNRHRRDERLAYLAAALHAERGEAAEAVELLGLAIELNPLNRSHALADPDFAALRDRGELGALLRRT